MSRARKFLESFRTKATYNVGDRVKLSPYGDHYPAHFQGKAMIVTAVSRSKEDHPGYDAGVGGELYDLDMQDGTHFPYSVYGHELVNLGD